MPKNVDVNLRLKATDKVSKTLARIASKFPKLSRNVSRASAKFAILQRRTEKLRRSLKKMGTSMRGAGRSMTAGMTLPIGLAGAAILSTAVKFQKSINKVGALTRTIIGGKVSDDFLKLEALAKKLGSTTEFSSTQAADAMGLLGRAGFNTNEIMAATDDVLALASASGMDLAFTADTMAKTIRAFGLEASDAGRVSDVLADISRRTNVDLETMSETFKDAAPVARAYGATLEQTAAITGLLGDVGIQGSKAGTTLKSIMLKLAAPSKKAAAVLEKLNITVVKGANGMNDVGAILSDLGPKLAKFPKRAQLAAINELFGLRGIAGASALMSKAMDEGRNPVAAMTKILQGSTGAAKDMQKTMLRGSAGAMARFQSALEGFALAIADSGLLEAFTGIVERLGKMFSNLSKVNPVFLRIGVIIAIVVAVMGPLLIVIGSIVALLPLIITGFSILGAITLPITGTILAIVAAIGALIFVGVKLFQNWSKVKEFFIKLWDGPLIKVLRFATPIGLLITLGIKLVSVFMSVAPAIGGAFDFLFSKIKKVFDFISPSLAKIADLILFGKGETFFGAPAGAKQATGETINRKETTNNAQVDINIKAPKGTDVSTKSDFGLNLGVQQAGSF